MLTNTLDSTPFRPISKQFAAELFEVCVKTIDNYIKAGDLPAPVRIGAKEYWLPEIFYAELRKALTPKSAPIAPGSEDSQVEEQKTSAKPATKGKVPRDSSPAVNMRQRDAAMLKALNA